MNADVGTTAEELISRSKRASSVLRQGLYIC